MSDDRRIKHGACRTPEYAAWACMIGRCGNPKHRAYKDYGGRGITVCPEWRASFETFLSDMGPRPGPLFSLDREDNDKGYSPGNCRWATAREQVRNSRAVRWVEFQGRRMILSDAAAAAGLPRGTVAGRLFRGMSVHDALTTPLDESRAHRRGMKKRA